MGKEHDYGGNRSRLYIKCKRPEVSECNIYGVRTQLTWDHVPPKSVMFDPAVYANTMFSQIPSETNHMKEYQNGIKFRSVCRECNNVVLGRYDQDYKEFLDRLTNAIVSITLREKEFIPRTGLCVEISCKINRVLRAICGHMLAAKERYDSDSTIEKDLREYVLNDGRKIKDFHVFSWVYPYSTVVIMRDYAVADFYEDSHPHGVVSIINSFPLAIVISTSDEQSCILDDLSSYSTENIEEDVSVRIHMDTVFLSTLDCYKQPRWPGDVSNDRHGAMFVLGNDSLFTDSRFAVRKNNR